MSKRKTDKRKISKAYGGERFTYASPHDSWFKWHLVTFIENLTGRKFLQKIYDELHEEGPNPYDTWESGFKKLSIGLDYDASQLEKAPKTGPVIFIANHPFGVVDGIALIHLVTRVRRDYFLLANEVLTHEEFMKPHLLPVDFRQNEEALQTNLRTKARTTERLNNGEALAIFPSGAVATSVVPFTPAVELPWRKFICTRIHETKCTVVPIFFHGQNSRLFQLVSKGVFFYYSKNFLLKFFSDVSMIFRMGMLLNEVMNKRNKTVKVTVGDPIQYSEMAQYEDRQDLIDFLKLKTLALGGVDKIHLK